MAWELKPVAERGEEEAAGITGPACPFCGSRTTTAVTFGWPWRNDSEGEWACSNCDESGPFDAAALHYTADGVAA